MKARYKTPRLTQKETDIIYKEIMDRGAASIIAAVLLVLDQRKWHKEKIIKFYEDILYILDFPQLLGKELHDYDVKKYLTKKYGIDFSKVNVKVRDVCDENRK